jgi:hypothetical protein
MARRTRAKTTDADSATPPTQTVARIALDYHGDSLYANFAEVSSAQHEFQIRFAQAPTKLDDEQLQQVQGGGFVRLEALVQILLPPTLIPGLIRALETTKQQHEALLGPIKEFGV